MKHWHRAVVVAIALLSADPAQSQSGRLKSQVSGIWQLIETRDGKTSCWGAVIQLDRLTFPKFLDPSAIQITEAKHGHEVKDLMQWQVDSTRKRLMIKFRPGNGDFGTGNRVEVRIKRQAVDPDSVLSGFLSWALETDPL